MLYVYEGTTWEYKRLSREWLTRTFLDLIPREQARFQGRHRPGLRFANTLPRHAHPHLVHILTVIHRHQNYTA